MGVLRFSLAVLVMIGHLAFYPNAILILLPPRIAVEAFYVVSGFLITLVLTERYQHQTLIFYINRLLRILPTYWACLAIYVLANLIVVHVWQPPVVGGWMILPP